MIRGTEVAVPKGVAKERLRAVTTCVEKRWGPGVVLRSREWSGTLRITEVGERYVYVLRGSHRERVFSFPEDVSAVAS